MALALVLNRRRQVPAEDSPAFGAIAERFRRAGELERAVALCQEGLQKYPKHLSSRVTLGWALLDLGRYDEARVELEQVLKRAPDNLAAIRGLAQLHDRTEHDDVASMQSTPSRWPAPESMPELIEDEAVVDSPVDDPQALTLDARSGPWVGLEAEPSPALQREDPPRVIEEVSEVDALAAELLGPAPRPAEPIATPPAWSQPLPPPAQPASGQPVAHHDAAADQDDDIPWLDDAAFEAAERASAAPSPFGPVPAGRPAVPYDEIVLDDGPGPWPPVLQDDDIPAQGRELRLAHANAERDVWPPFESRPAARAVVAPPPPAAPAEATPLPEQAEPPRPGLLSALSRFRRRVDSRRKAVGSESEYVAG